MFLSLLYLYEKFLIEYKYTSRFVYLHSEQRISYRCDFFVGCYMLYVCIRCKENAVLR